MTDDDGRTNLKITDEVHADHNATRKELGLSWTEYLRRCEYVSPHADREGDTEAVDADAIAKRVVDRFDVAHLANAVASEVVDRLR
jgi:hypothetical protein